MPTFDWQVQLNNSPYWNGFLGATPDAACKRAKDFIGTCNAGDFPLRVRLMEWEEEPGDKTTYGLVRFHGRVVKLNAHGATH